VYQESWGLCSGRIAVASISTGSAAKTMQESAAPMLAPSLTLEEDDTLVAYPIKNRTVPTRGAEQSGHFELWSISRCVAALGAYSSPCHVKRDGEVRGNRRRRVGLSALYHPLRHQIHEFFDNRIGIIAAPSQPDIPLRPRVFDRNTHDRVARGAQRRFMHKCHAYTSAD